jgi:hypothetical protein
VFSYQVQQQIHRAAKTIQVNVEIHGLTVQQETRKQRSEQRPRSMENTTRRYHSRYNR